jgi:hypothetical protein
MAASGSPNVLPDSRELKIVATETAGGFFAPVNSDPMGKRVV